MKVSDSKPHPGNPRKITDEQLSALQKSLGEFGDLSGFVHNEKTGRTVSGHQRGKIFDAANVVIEKAYDKPTKTGTVAEGYVIHKGERFAYRQVRWSPTKELAAMVAANKHGGEFDLPALKDVLSELDTGSFDMILTGYTQEELEAMMTAAPPERGKTPEDQLEGYENSSVRQIVLIMGVQEFERLLPRLEALREALKVETNSEAAIAAINAYADAHTPKTNTRSKAVRPEKGKRGGHKAPAG